MKQKKDIVIIGLIILIGGLLFISMSKFIEASGNSKNKIINYPKPVLRNLEGQILPSFKLLMPDSSTYVDVSKSSPDKAVVLFYFGPDCPYCQAEISEIIKEIDKLKDIQFFVLTAYPFDQMTRFYKNYQLGKYPNIITGYDYKFFFFEYFKIESVPGMAIYGKDKRLKGVFLGNISYKQILDLSEK